MLALTPCTVVCFVFALRSPFFKSHQVSNSNVNPFFSQAALYELIALLAAHHHPNVVRLFGLVQHDFFDGDLEIIMVREDVVFCAESISCLTHC